MAADPRRFRGHLVVHVGLILACLAAGGGTVAARSTAGPTRSVVLPRGTRAATRTETQAGAAPASTPPVLVTELDAQLASAGYELPESSDVYAVRIDDGPGGPTYERFEAGAAPWPRTSGRPRRSRSSPPWAPSTSPGRWVTPARPR